MLKPPEPAFLISAVRHVLDPASPMPIPDTLDWPALLDLAQAYAVTPMLYTALPNESLPDGVAEDLHSRFEHAVRRSLAQSAELARLAGLFEKGGIPMVALKGPMLSLYLYGDLASRVSGDIDVLVKQEDVLRVRDALISNGYRAMNSLPWNSRSACLRLRGREMAFESPLGVSVDVHWRLVPPHFASVFDKTDPWETLRVESLAGHPVQTLSPENQLLFLCVHGSKHMFERLGWICDIARFLVVKPDLDWNLIRTNARAAYASRQIILSFQLAIDLFGVRISTQISQDPSVEPLIRTVRTRLLAGAIPPAPALDSARFCFRLFERSGHQIKFFIGEYLTPSEAEYRVLQLPLWLHSLYYLFRPLRLLWRQVIRPAS